MDFQVDQLTTEPPQTVTNASGVETEEKMKKKEQKPAAQFECPECKAKGISKEFQNASGRASHRSRMHGVQGSSSAVRYQRMKAAKAMEETGPKRKKSLPTTALAPIPRKEGVPLRDVLPADEITPAFIGYAMGRMQSFVEQIARESKLPEKEFMVRVAQSFAELMSR